MSSKENERMPQKTKRDRRRPTENERIDESLEESFPASDPPAHSGVVPGGPRRERKKDDRSDRKRQR
jgi:hypothetical protein